jgi:uncharacterized cupredoxin-like copper-binding protein
MTDQMRFIPAPITVKQGDVVRFLPVNRGKVRHEMVLGRMEDLKQHAELMKKHPDMEHDKPTSLMWRPERPVSSLGSSRPRGELYCPNYSTVAPLR